MNIKKLFLAVLLASLVLVPSSKSFSAVNDGIIAIVNDDVITLKDLHEFLSMVYMELTSSKRSQEEIKETMNYYQENGLEKLIDEKLKIAYADKIELKIRPETIDKRIQDIKKQYPDGKAFSDELISQGMTLTDLRKKILNQFKAYYAEEVEIKEKIIVSPQQVTEFYQQNLPKFLKPERANITSIFIPYGEDKNLAVKNAQEALKTVKDPAQLSQYPKGFDDVAQKFSGIASSQTVQKGEMLPEVEKIIFSLNPTEIS
ncbi:MAG: SurA N-terminal domain-containing protein, partial [Candidatus Omnitrophota bacterium]